MDANTTFFQAECGCVIIPLRKIDVATLGEASKKEYKDFPHILVDTCTVDGNSTGITFTFRIGNVFISKDGRFLNELEAETLAKRIRNLIIDGEKFRVIKGALQ